MKKKLSLLLVLAMIVSLFAGISLTASAADAALEIYTQTGDGEAVLLKAYTADELAAMAERNPEGYGYLYYQKGAEKAVAATEYVTLDALLSDAGTAFADGDRLSFVCADGPYTKGNFSYENLSARGVDADGNAVPTAVALTWESGSLEDGTIADLAANAKNTGSLRFVSGMTEEEKENKSAAGNRMPDQLVSITVVKAPALTIYTQDGNYGTPVFAKAYTAGELAAMAERNPEGYGYLYYQKGAEKAVAATEYVTLDALLSDAGAGFAAGDKLSFVCADGPYTKGNFSYENISARGVDADGNAVPTAVALTWESGSLEDGTIADLAANAKNTGSLRFVSGMTEEEKENKSAAGNRMPDQLVSITVVSPVALGFTDIEAGYYYEEPVQWAVETGVTNGTTAATFSPYQSCTRGQMVTLLWRAAGSPAPTTTETAFTDLDEGQYYYDAVLWAVEKGITNGVNATTFAPDATVTRGQAVTFLYRYENPEIVSDVDMPFTDVPADSYYYDAIRWAYAVDITKGTSETAFSPDADCVRAQIVTFLFRDFT